MRRCVPVLLACLALATPLSAQAWEDYDYENLEFRGIGLDLGGVAPARLEGTLSLALRVDLGYLGPGLRIAPSLSYWSSRLRQREVDRLASQIIEVCLRQQGAVCPSRLDLGEIRLSDLALNLEARYEWLNTPLAVVPFLGLGGSLHLLNGRGAAINGTFIEDFFDGITPGVAFIGGVRVPMTPTFELVGETRYVLASQIRHAAVSVGTTWLFPRSPPPQQQ